MQNAIQQIFSFSFLNIKRTESFRDSVLCLCRTITLNYKFILHFAFSILHLIIVVFKPLDEVVDRLELNARVADLESLRMIHHESVDKIELTGLVFLILALTCKAAVSPIRRGGVLAPGAVIPIISSEGIALRAHTVEDRIVQAVALGGVFLGVDQIVQLVGVLFEIVELVLREQIDCKLVSTVGNGTHRLKSAVVIVILLEASEFVENELGNFGVRVAAGIEDTFALQHLRDRKSEEFHDRRADADMRDWMLRVDRAALALGMTDDEGYARDVVVSRGSLCKEAMRLKEIAVVGGVHYHRAVGHALDDLAYEVVGIGVATEIRGLLDLDRVSVLLGIALLRRPDLLMRRLALKSVPDRGVLREFVILIHARIGLGAEEGAVRLVERNDKEVILILILLHKIKSALEDPRAVGEVLGDAFKLHRLDRAGFHTLVFG